MKQQMTMPPTSPSPLWRRVVDLFRTARSGGEAATEEVDIGNDDYIFGVPAGEEADPPAATKPETKPKPKGKPKPKADEEEEEEPDDEDLEEEEDEEDEEDLDSSDDDEEEEDEDLDDEEDEEEEDEEDEGDEEDEEVEYRLPQKALDLQDRWATRLERGIRERDEDLVPPTLQLGLKEVALSDDGRKRFKAAMEKAGEDADAQADAAFEVGMDAVIQVLGLYDRHRLEPRVSSGERRVSKKSYDRAVDEFRKSPEGKAMRKDRDLQDRMSQLFDNVEKRYGWRAAFSIPQEEYFQMAGGDVKAKGKGKGKKKRSARKRDKDRALGAASAPRGGRPTGPRAGKRRAPKDEERVFGEYLKESAEPLFEVE